ncbi:hypothetical protein [Streptomyces malaysiense]|uniref:Uncharacterized protein n=1 Tax=Streptomyces malaysiense TaxID=1428626 RepID=A0A1J4PXP9_9ACTN|nr:hypothetical protein [Streptomyces malaysiense]OIK25474.1 hypothetical protein VT52_021630 [Streptomyces malaysiense]
MSKKAPGAPPPFVLWREVLTAYAMPAVTAGLGGVVAHQPQLAVAAPTTIGGTSAVVAAALGAVLRRRVRSRPTRTPRALAAAGTGLAAAALALLPGLAAAHWLPLVPVLGDSPWPRRLPIDLPVSSAIAATITTWRWRGSRPDLGAGRPLDPSLRPEGHTP